MRIPRQKVIIDMLMKDGMVKTADLIEKLGVSVETIRRDFKQLEKDGVLKKTYGGAVLASTQLYTELGTWNERMQSFNNEKYLITQRAVELIPNDCLLATDSGTTMYELAKHLCKRSNLKVITNDIHIAREILRNSNSHVYLIGGLLTPGGSSAGFFAKEFLSNFSSIDIYVFSTDGVTLDDGFTMTSPETNELKKLLIEKAAKKIVVVDHSKFGRKAYFKTCNFETVDIMITDSLTPPNVIRDIQDKGVLVEVIPVDSTDN